MEQLRARAIKDEITTLMEKVAASEDVTPEFICQGVKDGTIVILGSNVNSKCDPVAIGTGLRCKVSASIGLYGPDATVQAELEKIAAATEAKTDAIMDLSVSGDIDNMRSQTLAATTKPVGTLPLYQALAEAQAKHGSSLQMTVDELFEVIRRQAEAGVDFLALHCGTTMDVIQRAKSAGRVDPLVSYGGGHLIGWMLHNKQENPLYEYFDRVLEIAAAYDVTLSFADGMRPGALADSLDDAQINELLVLGELVKRARAANVQVMVKGPGHVPLEQIKTTIALQKRLCHQAPYFVFGPLVTDSTVGYDHISAAIGGAISAWAGAEFLCYVTPAEHMGLPDVSQVREGVIAARIAAHAGDLARQLPSAVQQDNDMSTARKNLDWVKQFEYSLDPTTAQRIWKERSTDFSSKCTMCGPYCAMEIISEYLNITNLQEC